MSRPVDPESGYRIKDGDNEWYITYKIDEGEPRIITGDTITFYGEFKGLRKMKRAFTGVTDLVPNLKAEIQK